MTTLPFHSIHSIHKQLKTNEKEKEKIYYFRPEGSNVKLGFMYKSYIGMFQQPSFHLDSNCSTRILAGRILSRNFFRDFSSFQESFLDNSRFNSRFYIK